MAFVPFLLVTWSSAAFIISYVVAVLSGHVNPFLPYIRHPPSPIPSVLTLHIPYTFHIELAVPVVHDGGALLAFVCVIVCASLIPMTKLEWDPKEKDYVYHMVSAICEWTVAFGFIFYFLTFIQDFQSVTLRISTEINDDF
ncbi:hypothetical protein A6R68_09481 [Neotoma lepida]|uniref:CWH43-like N-terminal domain-containing protein n=1 Tax=Neotoma lepida TaxID=56216 RepID=A0A1A6FZN2_NEOLE|nr:hypothetical protein A6R68_09481 [Neotoma lepida]